MYHQKKLIKMLEFEQARCAAKLEQLERAIENAPAGYLAFTNNNYYHVIKHHGQRVQKIIPKNNAESLQFVNSLREKRYITKALPILRNNLKFYNKLLENIKEYDVIALQAALPRHYQEYNCSKLMLKGDINPEVWSKASYTTNSAFTERLIHKSAKGLMTRSKAESMIATRLEARGLIFRYEPELWLENHHYFPDFVIIHPKERRLIYWEHFGMMDDPGYVSKAMDKLRVYSEHAICLGDNLIITWESAGDPLNFNYIDDRIQIYLS